jgi:hypothetical protein
MLSRTGATRRAFIGGVAATSVTPIAALAQQQSAATGTPPSVIRRANGGATPSRISIPTPTSS